jgi:AcrR family transcriptional regulator
MTDEKRKYTKRARARLEEETRRRITESAVHLHGTLGPARTSVSAVAEHAGVRRSTVYRHFPDEASLFAACSAHWASANPVPDPQRWTGIADPGERLYQALVELYGYFRRNEQMLANLLRDEEAVPVVGQLFGGFHRYLAGAQGALLAGRALRGRRRRLAAAAVGHAVAFTTWRSLAVEQGLEDARAAELMCRLVAAATSAPR